jgi:uncharacterized protein
MDHSNKSPSVPLFQRGKFRNVAALAMVATLASCRGTSANKEVEMTVSRVVVDETAHTPVVLLEDKQQTMTLPIWIGVSEAQAIALEMEGVQSPRPLTHDLVKQLLERLEVEFERAVITELRDGTYYARIHLVHRGDALDMDSRPSDAIALAVRFRKPIFVTHAVLQQQRAVANRRNADATSDVGGLMVQPLSSDLAEHFGLEAGIGVIVTAVSQPSQGVQRGDVIVAVDGEPVRSSADLHARLRANDGAAELSIHRGDDEIEVAFEMEGRESGGESPGN